MAIIHPPVTGDNQLDSWTYQVTQQLALTPVNTTAQVAVSSGGGGGGGGTVVNAATLELYKAYTAGTIPASEDIQVETQYTYATGVLTDASMNSTFNGWSRTIPSSDEDYIFVIQVNIADTANIEVISAATWSTPALIFRKATDLVQVRIATDNGTALRTAADTTTLQAVVSINGEDQNDIAHNAYDYKWTIPSGAVVCVDSSRNIINSGDSPLTATGTGMGIVCTTGTPAWSEADADVHGSALREITVDGSEVDKSQPFRLEVSNIPD